MWPPARPIRLSSFLRTGLPAGLLALAALAEAVPREALEEVAARYFDPGTLERGRDYRRFGYVLYFIQIALFLVVLWTVAHGRLGRWGDRFLALARGRRWAARALVLSALFLALAPLRFGFSALRFAHARDYGLRHDSWGGFVLDWLKGAGVGWLLLLAVGLLVLTLFSRWRRAWWGIAVAAVSLLTVGYVYLAPLVVDPLFHTFTRLDDPALEARLLGLSAAAGVPAREVWVADASRRTRSVNAYVTGVGESRRIVLYDTLLRGFEEDEVASVLAHELGHLRGNHLRWGILFGLAGAALGLAVAHVVLGRWADRGRRGIRGRADPALAIPAYALYVTLMTAAVVPANWVSRRMETAADAAEIELTGDPGTSVRTRVRLGRENLSDVLPPSWIEFTLYTHPAGARRIFRALGAERAQ